ncbi:MAG: DUF2256 domain-containing protein [Gemmataceae bacterium]
MKKTDLPTKTCLICNRPFVWRKKWAKVWESQILLRKHAGRESLGQFKRLRQGLKHWQGGDARTVKVTSSGALLVAGGLQYQQRFNDVVGRQTPITPAFCDTLTIFNFNDSQSKSAFGEAVTPFCQQILCSLVCFFLARSVLRHSRRKARR